MAEATAGVAVSTYYDADYKLTAVKLLPGEYYVTGENMLLATVLGSCVAACIRDPLFGIGGMNHFMLPESVHEADSPLSSSARYGVYAMEVLINELIKRGARRHKLEAKVFGGGNVLRGLTVNNVGERNAAFVQAYLKTEKIPVLACDLTDIYPRKIYYFPSNGAVMVKKLRNVHNDTIFEREKDYTLRLRKSKMAGSVELFG